MLQKQFSEIDTSAAVVPVQEEQTSVALPIAEETRTVDRLRKRTGFLDSCPDPLQSEGTLTRRTVRYLQTTLENFSDKRWRERSLAAWALGSHRIPAELQEEIGRTLGEILRNADASLLRTSRIAAWLTRSFLGFSLGAMLTMIPLFLASPNLFGNYALLDLLIPGLGLLVVSLTISCAIGMGATLLSAPLIVPLGCHFDARRADQVRIASAEALGRMGRPESIEALAGALFDKNPQVREAAEGAFRSILPTLKEAHYGRLGADAVANLCRALDYQETQLIGFPADQERLVFRILEALEKVGDGNAVRPVRQIVEKGLTTRIRDEAERILPTLVARQRRENEPKILLRATTMPADLPAQLLRPANPAEADPPEQLLRPSGGG